MNEFREHLPRNMIIIAVLIAVALVSFFSLGQYYTNPDNFSDKIEALNKTEGTVLDLTAASTAVSVAITLLPGDTATPIADKLAGLSTYFLIVLCALFFEKYLLTITAFAAFRILIPVACLFGILFVLSGRHGLRRTAQKLTLFALVLFLAVPLSISASGMIQKTYEASIETTINAANEASVVIEESSNSGEDETGIFKSILNKVKDAATSSVKNVTEYIRNLMTRFLEALAVMLVTSCIIPIAVMIFLIWLMKLFLNAAIPKIDLGRSNRKPEQTDNQSEL